MKWFKGDVVSAAGESRKNSTLVMVYVCGKDEKSRNMNSTFDNKEVAAACEEHCVSIKLTHDSLLARQFCEIYQLSGVPSTFLIGRSGVPLAVIEGHVSSRVLLDRLREAVEKNGCVFKESKAAVQQQPPLTHSLVTEQPEHMDVQPTHDKPAEVSTPKQEEMDKKPAAVSSNSRLQFRLPDGSNTSDVFPSGELLGSVWKQMAEKLGLRMKEFSLVTSHPRRSFAEEDMSSSLTELGLFPSAVVLVIPRSGAMATSDVGAFGKLISFLLGALLSIWTFITGIFSGGDNREAGGQSAKPAQSSDPTQSRQDRANAKRAQHAQSSQIRKRREGNITRLSALKNDDSDDEATYNGNSTQQM